MDLRSMSESKSRNTLDIEPLIIPIYHICVNQYDVTKARTDNAVRYLHSLAGKDGSVPSNWW